MKKVSFKKPLVKGETITRFPTNTQVFGEVKLIKLLNAANFKNGSAELWTVLIDGGYNTELWIPVEYNPTNDTRGPSEKGWY